MNYRRGEFYVTHSLSSNFLTGNFDPATLTNNSLETNAFVFSARAFPVFGRTKNFLAEKAIFLWFESSIVNRFRLLYLTVRPGSNSVGRRKADTNI